MATTFDGDNLIITLSAVVDGVLTVDVKIDLYSDWKEWVKITGNAKYPQAFRPDGGAPLSGIINQGSYYFLNNLDGWRIKPFENDGTYFIVGNLAVEDTSIETFLPTDGTFTTAILGLQPVTQGVTESMAQQLAFNTFQNTVAINTVTGVSGTGTSDSDPIGSRRAPSSNTDDAVTIAVREGLHVISITSNLNTDTQSPAAPNTDLSAGFDIMGDSPFIEFTAGTGVNLSNCSMNNLTLNGELDGVNNITSCIIGNITNVNGVIKDSELRSDIAVNGDIDVVNCYSGKEGVEYARLTTIGTSIIQVRNMKGSIGLSGMTGGTHTIGVSSGGIIIEADCSGGTVYTRGSPFIVTDLSGGAVTIIDQTEPSVLAAAVWNFLQTAAIVTGSMGAKLKKLLERNFWFGAK